MKQLITRLDEELHRRLKERAAEQNRSVNDLVSSVLAAAVADDSASARHRIDTSGLRVLPPSPSHAVVAEDVLARLRGTGSPALEALSSERDGR